MIKMKFIDGATRYATTAITNPDFEFYTCWNNAAALDQSIWYIHRKRFVFDLLDSD